MKREERELDPQDLLLLELLENALAGKAASSAGQLSAKAWDTLLQKADRHSVLPLLYDSLIDQPLTEGQRKLLEQASRKTVLQSYRLSYCTHRIVMMLAAHGISAVVLKGVTAAGVYPTPELRKSGDIDILLPYPEQLTQARDVLVAAGATIAESQHANHHLVMHYEGSIELELHTMLAEPFDNAGINRYLEDCMLYIPEHIVTRNIMGYDVPTLSDAYQAYQLLLHMLQHFLHAGFGLKLLCDWIFFWNRPVPEEEMQLYLKLTEESGLSGFSRMITSVCIHCLGMDSGCGLCAHMDGLMDKQEVFEFLADILEAEDFGNSSQDRVVVPLGTHFWDYVREFHHIMRLSFPRAGKIFLLWPFLWCITLFRFLQNNRRIRGVSARAVLKKAGERSRRIDRLALFKQEKRQRGKSQHGDRGDTLL